MQKPEIVDWIMADLRHVTGNQKGLAQLLAPWRKEHSTDIREGAGIIVEGLSVKTRPRIVYCSGGQLWALMVPWDPDKGYSMYIAVSEFMRKRFKMAAFIRETLDEEIERAKKLEKKARKKARKKATTQRWH